LPGGALSLIDESYNANPASMKAALELLAGAPVQGSGRRIAVLGDMLELGDHAAKLHAGLAELIKGKNIDLVLLAGPEMKVLAEKLADGPKIEYRANVDELKPLLMATVRAGDTVMIKSSKGVGFSKLVDALTNQFPAQAVNAKRA
jgi:UDP-N-acetylmuramoyl-tripeptide--D-alanyl-D-alanine ligase